MKLPFSYFIACFFLLTKSFAQPTEEDFNRAFLRIYMHTASEDVNQALQAADSLCRTAGNDVQKIRALMLVSDMHHRLASRDSSIHYAMEAGKIAEKTANHVWLARISGVLSTQHRETGLLTEGKRHLQKGLETIEKVANPEFVNQYKGQSFQELGYYAIEEGNFREAIGHFKRAEPFLAALADSVVRHFGLSQNHERLGLCYLKLGIVDSAKTYYQQALAFEGVASGADTPLKGFIYNGLGLIYVNEGQSAKADSCLQVALAIAETTGFPHLKIAVYQNLVHYYQRTGDQAAYERYNAQYLKEYRDNTLKHKKYADNILTRIQQQVVSLGKSNRMLTLSFSACVMLVAVGVGLYVRKQRKDRRRYKDVISRLRNEQFAIKENARSEMVALTDRDKELMPERTKQELLRKLERFESSQQFTDRNISIAVLAGKMKTNTKYLSYLINNYRNKDFNTYINELRIHYIIAKMENESRYLSYKISYLAEECGFATHSQFTTVFRNITGLSPSTFMSYLRREESVASLTSD